MGVQEGSLMIIQESKRSSVTDTAAEHDARLIARIIRGDQQALAELFLLYRMPLLHYLQQFTSDHGLAEEVLQDVFLAVWKGACSYEGKSVVKAWLFGIARRRACKTLSRHEHELIGLDELEQVPSYEPEPEASLLAHMAHAELLRAIEQLPVAQREVLLLVFVHGFSYQEVAEVLDVPVGTVKSRLNTARRTLRTLLQDGEELKR